MDLPWEPLPAQSGYFMMVDVTKCRSLIPQIYFETNEYEPDYNEETAKQDSSHITKNALYMPESGTAEPDRIPLNLAFTRWMAIENRVIMMPNCFFYPRTSPNISEDHVRLAICKDLESIKTVCRRLRDIKVTRPKVAVEDDGNFLRIRWLGHGGFRIAFNDPESGVERVVYVDVWLQNPKVPDDFRDRPVEDADLVLVTHGSSDYVSSAPDIVMGSKKPNAKVVSNFEIGLHFESRHGVSSDKREQMNTGATVDYGYCKVSMTPADHSSCCIDADGNVEAGGDPNGFVISIPHLDARIYHAGETTVFMDMQLIEEMHHPNIVMVPIGDRNTMGPRGAALACSRFFKSAKHIVPMNFGTFPELTGTYEAFSEELRKKKVAAKLVSISQILGGSAKSWNIDLSEFDVKPRKAP